MFCCSPVSDFIHLVAWTFGHDGSRGSSAPLVLERFGFVFCRYVRCKDDWFCEKRQNWSFFFCFPEAAALSVPSTSEIWLSQISEEWRSAPWQKEKDQYNGTVSYHALDTSELLGIEMFADQEAISVEDIVITQIMVEKLRKGMTTLNEMERVLLIHRHWEGESQKMVAERFRTSQQAVSYRERQILAKLKKYLEK